MALGCNDNTISRYQGGSMADVHKNMQVTNKVFRSFNALLLDVLKKAGVVPRDLTTIGSVLNGFQSAIVTKN